MPENSGNTNHSDSGGKIDLNSASAAELQRISDIGPEDAEKIIRERERRGGFKSIDELEQVPGFGPETVAQLKQSGTVGSREDA